jgi:hypothetical protein
MVIKNSLNNFFSFRTVSRRSHEHEIIFPCSDIVVLKVTEADLYPSNKMKENDLTSASNAVSCPTAAQHDNE